MKIIKKILSYPLTITHYLVYGLVALIFHPIQWLSLKLGGYNAHKKVVDIMTGFLHGSLFFLGTHTKFINKYKIPEGVPLIIVSNHQSLHDVTGLGWFMRKYHPKYVSKIELGKGLPSISFNLKHGGSVLINRKNPKQAISAIKDFSKYLEKNNRSAVIFPEGTRSRDGNPKAFRESGFKMLVKYAPTSYVIPITINNSWKIVKNGSFPLGVFNKIIFDVHKPIKSDSMSFEELFLKTEKMIKDSIII